MLIRAVEKGGGFIFFFCLFKIFKIAALASESVYYLLLVGPIESGTRITRVLVA